MFFNKISVLIHVVVKTSVKCSATTGVKLV